MCEPSCRNRLPDMPLGVVGYMDKQSSQSSGQPPLSHESRLFQAFHGECPHPHGRACQRGTQLREQFVTRCARVQFCFQASGLFGVETSSFGIRQQTVQATRKMTNMKRDGRRVSGTSIQLFIRKISTPSMQIFFRQLQSMKNRASDGWNIDLSTAQPRLEG